MSSAAPLVVRGEHPPFETPASDREPASSLAVLIPVFNGQDALERTLASLSKSDEQFDVFVIDDGSDPLIEVPAHLRFEVTLIRLPSNGGITKALNAGLRKILAIGYRYVARLDAGDLSLPGRFAAQMAFLEAHPDHAVVGAHVDYVDSGGRRLFASRPPVGHEALARYMRRRNGLEHPCVMIRSQCLETSGLYDERHCGAEDYELWRRLGRTYKLANLPEIFLHKETSSSQITARRFRSAARLRVQLRYFEPWSFDAYLGVLRSLVALVTTRSMILRAKRLREQWRLRTRPMARKRAG